MNGRLLLPILLWACAPAEESSDSASLIPTVDATPKSTGDELCDGKDNDVDGTVDEGCGQCDFIVHRNTAWWSNNARTCVLVGNATPYAILPQTVGSTSYTTPVAVRTMLKGTSTTALAKLSRQLLTAKLNRAASLTGAIPYTDFNADGTVETVDQLITLADTYVASGTNAQRNAMNVTLTALNGTGSTVPTWFDSTCVNDPEVCDDLDNDSDGVVDENCGCYEACDGVDNDLDGVADDGWTDSDGDTWASCVDCDDGDPDVAPDADEVCNGIDDDCDDTVDEAGALGEGHWWADDDGDGYGAGADTLACDAPSGRVGNDDDCDDLDSDVSPAATETCNGVDDDCDGETDEAGALGETTWYRDADGDGQGDDAVRTTACSAPVGYVANALDCDDLSIATHVGADETCNSIDDDCDTAVDEDAIDATTWYLDSDGDSYGTTAATTMACSPPSGYAGTSTDCDDGSSAINPGATEVRGDGIDNDCDGVSLNYTYSFATDVQTIFSSRCISCHDAGGAYGLDLRSGTSYGKLVNVASGELPSMDRIEPGSTSTSYLYHKIKNTQATVGGSGGRMPASGSALTTTQINIIATWITEGAPNN